MKPRPLPTVLKAEFLTEMRSPSGMPAVGAPLCAFAGRSNVGKSTLLNRMAARKQLARTSKTPGRTRGLMFYDLEIKTAGPSPDHRIALRFVDLPGYGYAKVSKSERLQWGPLVEGFVTRAQDMRILLVLVDGRRDFADEDRQLCQWLSQNQVPFVIVVTKADKLTAGARGLLGERIKRALDGVAAPVLPVSGQTGLGLDRLWAVVLKAVANQDPDGT